MVLRNTGLRVNEVLDMEVRHCMLEGPDFIIYVQRSKKRRTTEYEPIYINPGLGVQLRDYIKGNAYTMTEPIFGNAPRQRVPIGARPAVVPRRGAAYDGGVGRAAGDDDVGAFVQRLDPLR